VPSGIGQRNKFSEKNAQQIIFMKALGGSVLIKAKLCVTSFLSSTFHLWYPWPFPQTTPVSWDSVLAEK